MNRALLPRAWRLASELLVRGGDALAGLDPQEATDVLVAARELLRERRA